MIPNKKTGRENRSWREVTGKKPGKNMVASIGSKFLFWTPASVFEIGHTLITPFRVL